MNKLFSFLITGIISNEAVGVSWSSLRVEFMSFDVYSRFGKLECIENDWLSFISRSLSWMNCLTSPKVWSELNWFTIELPSTKRNCSLVVGLFWK